MTETTDAGAGTELEALQRVDDEISNAKQRIVSITGQLEEVEEEAEALAVEVETTTSRLKEMKLDERRLELSVEEKRARLDKLQERLRGARNVREQSAVSAELDMVKAALEGDEQEALTLLDQIRKMEVKLEEQGEALEDARGRIEPRRVELMDERSSVENEIDSMESRRSDMTGAMQSTELRLYERIRSDKGRKAVSRLTADGACGHCFNVLPLQLQNEVRHGADMVRCEACGVILAASDPTEDE